MTVLLFLLLLLLLLLLLFLLLLFLLLFLLLSLLLSLSLFLLLLFLLFFPCCSCRVVVTALTNDLPKPLWVCPGDRPAVRSSPHTHTHNCEKGENYCFD